MATITTRVQGDDAKGSPLTNVEVDNNFINLNTAKYESGDTPYFLGGMIGTNTDANPLYITRNSSTSESLSISMNDYTATFVSKQDESSGSAGSYEFRKDNGYGAAGLLYMSQANAVFNDDSIDMDFRVESNGNTHMLFVDGGNNYVGIGETPTSKLSINLSQNSSHSSGNGAITTGSSYNNRGLCLGNGGYGHLFGLLEGNSAVSGENYGTVLSMNATYDGTTWRHENGYIDPTALVIQNGEFEFYSDNVSWGNANTDYTPTKRMSIGQSGVVVNENGEDMDFRVESDGNTHMLFVDGGSSKVSIGSSGTARQFNNYINDSTTYNSTSFETSSLSYYMRNTDATVGAYTGIQFAIGTNSDCGIAGVRTADANAALVFGNRITGSGAIVERMRIDGGTGYVGIGNTSPAYGIDSNVDMRLNANGATLYLGSGAGTSAPYGVGSRPYGGYAHTGVFANKGYGAASASLGLETSGTYTPYVQVNSNGVTIVNESGADHDFRVESTNSSSAFFVNGGTDNVGINSDGTVGRLSIYYNEGSTSYANPHLFLRNAGSGGTGDAGDKCLITTGFTASIGAGFTPVAFGGVNTDPSGNRDGAFAVYVADTDNVDFSTDERMRVKENGLYVGTTTGLITSTGCGIGTNGTATFVCNLTSPNQAIVMNNNNATGTAYKFEFRQNNAAVGSIQAGSSGVTYYTTSDRRLKDNIETITDGTDKLMAMNPVTHTWKADPDAPAVHGFIAQEMQDVVPEAVGGEDGGEEMMSMDYGRITPVIVAALQDAHREIQNLKAEIAALKGDK